MRALILLLFVSFNSVIAQDALIIMNAKAIDTQRYKDFKGSPYLFDDWALVKVISSGGVEFNDVKGNYNSLDKEFEVYHENKFTLLPKSLYPTIVFKTKSGIEKTLQLEPHSDLKNNYVIIHEKNEKYSLLEFYHSSLISKKFESPGKTVDVSKIKNDSDYYLLVDDELIKFDLKEKKLHKAFGHKNEIKSFLKDNKIKLKNIMDIIPLLDFMFEKNWI